MTPAKKPLSRIPSGLWGLWNVFIWTFGFDAAFLAVRFLVDSVVLAAQPLSPASTTPSSFTNFDVLLAGIFLILNFLSLAFMLFIKLTESPPVIHKVLAIAVLLPVCGGLSVLFEFKSRREAIVQTAVVGKLCADVGWFVRGCVDGELAMGGWSNPGPFGRSAAGTVLVVLLVVVAVSPYPALLRLFVSSAS
ncbi:hypothetical protein ACEPPN_005392 [Leptodophora sp. 'Broadleaf-Isolate-01']